MFKIYDLDTALKTILLREPLITQQVPDSIKLKVEEVFGEGTTPYQAVTQILTSVREEGDSALRKWSLTLDKADLEDFLITPEDLKAAYQSLSSPLIDALETASERIRDFHRRQPLPNWTTTELGGLVGQRVTPVQRAGVYVPGGTAPLPSSLLMSVIPAQVAGVERIIVTTPPKPNLTILAAAY